jgi:hypothetical protein
LDAILEGVLGLALVPGEGCGPAVVVAEGTGESFNRRPLWVGPDEAQEDDGRLAMHLTVSLL